MGKTTLTVQHETLALIEEFRRKDETKEEAVRRAILFTVRAEEGSTA